MNIDFKIDAQELAEDLDYDIANLDCDLFVISMFMMPVKFTIGDLEVFKSESGVWVKMPIMNIASEGLVSLLEARIKGSETYMIIEGPGDILFTMIDYDHVEIYFRALGTEIRTVVNYNELLKAFFDFANKVRAFMWERVPQMNEHPYWGPWLRGEREY